MTPQTVKISIVIPIYNAENYLVNCFDSILKQTYPYFEVILINDGSSDNSENISLSYLSKDSRFKYFLQENKGVSEARNFGIKKATTEWICFVDPDDSIDPDYIKVFVENISDKKTLVITDFNRISQTGKFDHSLHYKRQLIHLKTNYNQLLTNIHFLVGNPFNKLYNLEVIKENQIWFKKGQTLGQDRLFYYDYIKCIDNLKYIDESQYNYHYRENSSITRIHHYNIYLNLIKGENEIFNNSDNVHDQLKTRYTSLFFQYLRALNKYSESESEKLAQLKLLSQFIKKKYIHTDNKRMLILTSLFNLRQYKALSYALKLILK